jgi:putative NIF3 family GTP cyclohydrolase 1 type 2
MQLQQILASLDEWLEPWRYKDYAPNGLQVEGGQRYSASSVA